MSADTSTERERLVETIHDALLDSSNSLVPGTLPESAANGLASLSLLAARVESLEQALQEQKNLIQTARQVSEMRKPLSPEERKGVKFGTHSRRFSDALNALDVALLALAGVLSVQEEEK